MNSEAANNCLVLRPTPKAALLAVAIILAVPMALLTPLALYANSLPPSPSVLNIETLADLGKLALISTGVGLIWSGYVFLWQRPQWRVSPAGIEVSRRGDIVRHILWSEIRGLKVMPIAAELRIAGASWRLSPIRPTDSAALKEYHSRFRRTEHVV